MPLFLRKPLPKHFLDLAGFQTFAANANVRYPSIGQASFYRVQIRKKSSLRAIIGMTNIPAYGRAFPTYFAYSCHFLYLHIFIHTYPHNQKSVIASYSDISG